ncbi:kinesin-like protein KIF23 [Brevipalpus obovatus]|uniref:kinesin-like protein KIF23 n=1 Tax=Brevipalpus obovatus TaxID=246614 RepID=UPI003D9F5CDA
MDLGYRNKSSVPRKTPSKKPPPTKPKPKFPFTELNNNNANGNYQNSSNGKDPVEVYCRLRPLKNQNDLICIRRINDNTLRLIACGNNKLESSYTFKYVFDTETSQKVIFDKVALPLIKDLLNGKNGLLFTYGITSSGKTFTVTGNSQDCGILPRTLDVIFNSISESLSKFKLVFKPDGQNAFEVRSAPDAILEWQKEKLVSRTPSAASGTPRVRRREADDMKEWEQREKIADSVEFETKDNMFAVFVSYVEIYNNYIYDLLDEDTPSDQFRSKQPQSKVLREDRKRRVYVNGVNEVEVRNADEAFDLFVKGIRRRRMAHTALNTESSRSHSVFNIRVVQAPVDCDGEAIRDEKLVNISQLSLVDLAGSERTQRTQNTGERLREAGNINNSLMALRQCIELLRENQKNGLNKIVPYRDNKLTHLFKSYFEGEGKIKMIICVNPGSADFDETLHVMKFAETTQEVLVNRPPDIPMYLRYPYQSVKFYSTPRLLLDTIGPPLPPIEALDYKDDKQWISLIEILEQRKRNKQRHFAHLQQEFQLFRDCLNASENDNMLTVQRMEQLKNDIEVRENQIKHLENKCSQLEGGHDEYVRKVHALRRELENIENQLEEKKRSLAIVTMEQERAEQRMRERLELEKDRMKRVFEKLLAEKQAALEREQCLTHEKIHLVRQILTAENTDWGVYRDYWESLWPNAAMPPNFGSQGPRGPGPSRMSRPSTATMTPDSGSTPSSAKRPKLGSDQLSVFKSTPVNSSPRPDAHREVQSENRTRSPNRGVPVINPRHRRSLSAGNDKWIDHRPQGTFDMGTVLKPKIKNKVSVPNLKDIDAGDLRRVGKYSLTTHFAYDQGDVETRVYKGDVIPSATGGAQVIFNDVEMMTQGSPPKN